MFNSAQSILDMYIDTDKVSRFTFYSVEMERGENPEDLYYLCSLKDRYYVVFETDYIGGTLANIAREAAAIFKRHGLSPLHWVVKKEEAESFRAATVPINVDNVDGLRSRLVSDKVSSPFGYAVRYAIMEFADTRDHKQQRFNPSMYGGVS